MVLWTASSTAATTSPPTVGKVASDGSSSCCKRKRNWTSQQADPMWEFEYKIGSWKSFPPYVNRPLEEQCRLDIPTAAMDIEPKVKYEWDFKDNLEVKKHLVDGEWKIVKTRSIGRIRVLSRPTTLTSLTAASAFDDTE